jgi:hypothetical protein
MFATAVLRSESWCDLRNSGIGRRRRHRRILFFVFLRSLPITNDESAAQGRLTMAAAGPPLDGTGRPIPERQFTFPDHPAGLSRRAARRAVSRLPAAVERTYRPMPGGKAGERQLLAAPGDRDRFAFRGQQSATEICMARSSVRTALYRRRPARSWRRSSTHSAASVSGSQQSPTRGIGWAVTA